MRKMLRTMEAYLMMGERLVLVTITAASGATPRGAGARMLVGERGRICGTIGGGAMEYRAEQIAQEVLRQKGSVRRDFSLTPGDVQNLGMICGGAVQVFFHYIPAGDGQTLALVREAQRVLKAGEALWLISDLDSGGALSIYTKKGGFFGHPVPEWMESQLSRRQKRIWLCGEKFCVEQIARPGRVYIFGGGHVSRALEPLLTGVGFRCVVMDDRPEFARREQFPTAEEVKLVDFSKVGESARIGGEDYVCILTRGHAFDTIIQAQVLPCRPRYVGVIGSSRKAAAVRNALKTQYGLSEEELNLVTTPIGLDIGAQTPEEIAVSITAQLIALRAKEDTEL